MSNFLDNFWLIISTILQKISNKILGYRPVPNTLKSALFSAFYPHNEWLNFWTHFLPGVEMVRRMYIFWTTSLPDIDKMPMTPFFNDPREFCTKFDLLNYFFNGDLFIILKLSNLKFGEFFWTIELNIIKCDLENSVFDWY